MEFLDEQIIELRRKEKAASEDIHGDGITINGELLTFKETLLLKDKMSIWLPESFVDMPSKIARIKYPSEQRPQIIKTDLLGSTNFAFNLLDSPVKPSQMQSTADGIQTILQKVNPANIFYENGTETLGKTTLSWFDFKGYGIDTQIYYIMFVTAIGGRLMHGIFNCAIADMEAWKDAAFQVIRSIEDKTTEV